MTLICELKQRVVHTSGVLLVRAMQWGGYFRNSRENPDFSASQADSWGEIICDPRIFLNIDNRLQRSKLSPKAGTTG